MEDEEMISQAYVEPTNQEERLDRLERGTKIGFYVRKPRKAVNLKPEYHDMLWEIKERFLPNIKLNQITELAIQNFLVNKERKANRSSGGKR